MKKIFLIFLIACMIFSFASCSQKEKKVELNRQNILNYVFFEASLGDVTKDGSVFYCPVTLTIKPKGDYSFKNVSCTCTFKDVSEIQMFSWNVDDKGLNENLSVFAPNPGDCWKGVINLDKDGYGEVVIYIKNSPLSETSTIARPKLTNWNREIITVEGTVTER